MSIIKWSEELSIGIGYIDEQHRQLIAMINELHAAVESDQAPDQVLPMIDRLLEYAGTHFKDEEELLHHHDFPEVADHKEEHLVFVERVHELRSEYETDRTGFTLHLRNFLLGWFFNHIKSEDMNYKHYLARKGSLPPDEDGSGQG